MANAGGLFGLLGPGLQYVRERLSLIFGTEPGMVAPGEKLPGPIPIDTTGASVDGEGLVYSSAAGKYVVGAGGGGSSAKWKEPVRVATTANLTLSGSQTVDGVVVAPGDRVLVRAQSTASQNGVYVAAAGAWSRASDLDTGAEFPGAALLVKEGATLADTPWICTNDSAPTLGSTAIAFSRFGVDESNLVHKTGTETITGQKNLSGAGLAVGHADAIGYDAVRLDSDAYLEFKGAVDATALASIYADTFDGANALRVDSGTSIGFEHSVLVDADKVVDLRNKNSAVVRVSGGGTLFTNGSGVLASDRHHAGAVAEFRSTDQGVLLPRMTTAQRDASLVMAPPATSTLIFNTTTGRFEAHNGTAWVALASLIGVAPYLAEPYTNGSGGTIDEGTPCYLSAANNVSPARANADATAFVLCIALASVANGASGLFARVRGGYGTVPIPAARQTGAWTAGQRIYLDDANLGKLTNVRPTAPGTIAVEVGQCLNTPAGGVAQLAVGEQLRVVN